MRFILTLAVALFGFAGAAYADPFANYYSNTLTVTDQSGGQRKALIDEGGTYSLIRADGSVAHGHWEIKGDQGCFMEDAAPADKVPYCIAAVLRNVGDSWDVTAPDGTVEKAALAAGR